MSDNPARESEVAVSGRSAQYGLAALWLGGLVTLLAPATLIVNILLAAFWPDQLHMAQPQIGLASYGLLVGITLVLFLGLSGVVFGIVGLGAARAQRQSLALPLAGLLVSVVGLLLFLLVSIDTVFVLAWFNQAPLPVRLGPV
jgi:hypothetical protein